MGSFEFTATLFDLIRRGHYTATPSTTERKTCAAAQRAGGRPRHQPGLGGRRIAHGLRAPIVKVVDDVLNGGTEHLSSFRDRISDDRKKNSERFSAFKSTVKDAIEVAAGSRTRRTGRLRSLRHCS